MVAWRHVFVVHCFILQNGVHVKYLCNWCHSPRRWPVNWPLTHHSSSECCCCPKGPNKEPVMQWLPIPLHHCPPLMKHQPGFVSCSGSGWSQDLQPVCSKWLLTQLPLCPLTVSHLICLRSACLQPQPAWGCRLCRMFTCSWNIQERKLSAL